MSAVPIEIEPVDPAARRGAAVGFRSHRDTLRGELEAPVSSGALVVLARAGGNHHDDAIHAAVRASLLERGCATLLLDLLTTSEDAVDRHTGAFQHDAPRLARRLVDATRALEDTEDVSHLPLGYFAIGGAAAAALAAASELPAQVDAIVAYAARADLVAHRISLVHAPTLLLAGVHDAPEASRQQDVAARMGGRCEVVLVPARAGEHDATNDRDAIAAAAARWFGRVLLRTPRSTGITL